MLNLKQILTFLDGKKVVSSGCIMAVFAYLASAGTITPELNALIATLCTILFGTASIVTPKVLGGRRK